MMEDIFERILFFHIIALLLKKMECLLGKAITFSTLTKTIKVSAIEV